MMRQVFAHLDGQHVYLFTGAHAFYESLGFKRQGTGMALVVGSWLHNATR